jgi:ABC-2 type transport system ATP-binding protein
MIQVEGLTKRYASAVAVDHISFSVTKGQIVGFLGPNGAGKTTTMRMLTCFMPPTEGTATVAGFDIVKSPMEVKKRIGYLPETPPLYPDMEVGEYLEFVARLKQVPSAQVHSRSKEVAERCSLSPEWNKLISKLSKGYRQRVGLAQAIIHNPDVLILDEPTSGFDPKQIMETRDLIKSLAGDHTIILSTHILQEVEAMCESVVIISKGKVVAQDRVETLTARMLGGESAQIELSGRSGELNEADVLALFGKLAGVTKVIPAGQHNGRLLFEVDAASGSDVRPEIARAAVEAGWNLHKLQSTSLSLEDIFLQLTGSPVAPAGPSTAEPAPSEEESQ